MEEPKTVEEAIRKAAEEQHRYHMGHKLGAPSPFMQDLRTVAELAQMKMQEKDRAMRDLPTDLTDNYHQHRIEEIKKKVQAERQEFNEEMYGMPVAERVSPHLGDQLKRIKGNLEVKTTQVTGPLECPVCHDPDRHNRMGKTPWCFKCQIPLMDKSKIGKSPQSSIKVIRETVGDRHRKSMLEGKE